MVNVDDDEKYLATQYPGTRSEY